MARDWVHLVDHLTNPFIYWGKDGSTKPAAAFRSRSTGTGEPALPELFFPALSDRFQRPDKLAAVGTAALRRPDPDRSIPFSRVWVDVGGLCFPVPVLRSAENG